MSFLQLTNVEISPTTRNTITLDTMVFAFFISYLFFSYLFFYYLFFSYLFFSYLFFSYIIFSFLFHTCVTHSEGLKSFLPLLVEYSKREDKLVLCLHVEVVAGRFYASPMLPNSTPLLRGAGTHALMQCTNTERPM